MRTTAEERAAIAADLNLKPEAFSRSVLVLSLLADIDELLAERRTLRDDMAMSVVGNYMHLCNDAQLANDDIEIATVTEYASQSNLIGRSK